jgi:hypothetical protein
MNLIYFLILFMGAYENQKLLYKEIHFEFPSKSLNTTQRLFPLN